MKQKILLALFFCTTLALQQGYSQSKLNSFPSAPATIFLDFDGEEVNTYMWNNGNPFTAAPAALNDIQITEIFNRVAEDYRPFNVNITTDENVFLSAPINKRIRIIVTPTSAWFPGVGGVSYVGSFTWGDDTPGFVFSDKLGNKAKEVAECCSHESGHSLGLSHQSKYDATCNLTAKYNDGIGQGEIGWAPIMGNSYYRNMSGWNNGPTPYGCSNVQDNLSIIVTQNGFGYRQDDHSDDFNDKPTSISTASFNINGLISTSSDKDVFTITLDQNSTFHLDANPFSVNNNNEGADLDIKLSLYDAAKNLIRTYNPESTMSASIDTLLNAGEYYLVVNGTGNTYASEYSSLGSYTITGAAKELPVCSVQLSGSTDNNQHLLNWTLSCYQALKNISVQSSADGINFSDLDFVDSRLFSFASTANTSTDLYYRLKITSTTERIVYSNIVLLKKVVKPASRVVISSFVTNELTITAFENFQYRIIDLNGNNIKKGSGTAGYNRIDMAGKTPGIYILQLAGSTQRQTQKVIKQ
jgi:hypothetical protein